jgi:hypothetical protein
MREILPAAGWCFVKRKNQDWHIIRWALAAVFASSNLILKFVVDKSQGATDMPRRTRREITRHY